jgi:hypothetical protein
MAKYADGLAKVIFLKLLKFSSLSIPARKQAEPAKKIHTLD